jgi:transposase
VQSALEAKGYSEVVWRQTTECFIRCLENSFRHFGGVPRTLVIDFVARHIMLSGVSALVRPQCVEKDLDVPRTSADTPPLN